MEGRAIDLQDQLFGPVCVKCQEREIFNFLGIDNQGGFGPEKIKAAKDVARRVADAPFHQCVPSKDFKDKFTSKHLAAAVKAQGAHCIYVKDDVGKDTERYCAASPSVHDLLQQMAPKPKRWGMF